MPGDIDADAVNEFVASCYPQLGVQCLDVGEEIKVSVRPPLDREPAQRCAYASP